MIKSNTFTAIDFETAQGYRHSICQIGLIRFEKGVVTKEIDILVQPPDNYYWWQFTDIHGIDSNTTKNSPTFDKIWHIIEPYIANQHIVAHNASFDIGCLKTTLAHYAMPVPEFTHACTCNLYGRKGLAQLCKEHKIQLNHHNALSDAMACAKLYLMYLKK